MEQNIEIWKDIPGYEGYYQVSSFGRVRSLTRVINGKTFKGKILSAINNHGYLYVHLLKNGIDKKIGIHRIVGRVFVPGYKECLVVNHKDYITTNNNPDNLEWCTQKENVNYGLHNERLLKSMEPLMRPVVQLTPEGKFVARYKSINEAERATGAYRWNIRNCCLRKFNTYTANGYVWRFENDANLPVDYDFGNRRAVIQTTLSGKIIATYCSISQAARATGISYVSISFCCNGKREKVKGYKWKFKNESK